MKLSDLNKLFFFLIILINFSILNAENEIDIWKKNNSSELNKEEKKVKKNSKARL